MRFLLDHNLSPHLAHALQHIFIAEHEILALRDRFPADVADVDWIDALSREGRWVVLSGDRRITRNMAERQAFRHSRLIGMFLAPAVANSPVIRQAQRMLALWPTIVSVAASVEGGAMFELPVTSSRLRLLGGRDD